MVDSRNSSESYANLQRETHADNFSVNAFDCFGQGSPAVLLITWSTIFTSMTPFVAAVGPHTHFFFIRNLGRAPVLKVS